MSCDDYCNNYGCNQGRDCPARKCPITEKRARNLASALAGYALVLVLLMFVAMAAASWLALYVPGGA